MADEIVDIEEIVKAHAWTSYLKTASSKKMKLEEVLFDIKWNRVSFQASKPQFQERLHPTTPASSIIFESTFNNTTNNEQQHTLKAERTTSIMSTTSVNKGYTMGGNLSLSLAVPGDVLKVTGAFGRQVNMQKTTGSTEEKLLTWSTDDSIKVKPRSKLTAQVEVKEAEYTSKFTIDVAIKGKVVTVITNPRENNNLLQIVDADIVQVLKDSSAIPRNAVKIDRNQAVWRIEGLCDFKYGVSQSILLSEQQIN